MKVLVADNDERVYQAFKDYDPDFEVEFGNPMAYDIDAVVSPANTQGLLDGGFDALKKTGFQVIQKEKR